MLQHQEKECAVLRHSNGQLSQTLQHQLDHIKRLSPPPPPPPAPGPALGGAGAETVSTVLVSAQLGGAAQEGAWHALRDQLTQLADVLARNNTELQGLEQEEVEDLQRQLREKEALAKGLAEQVGGRRAVLQKGGAGGGGQGGP